MTRKQLISALVLTLAIGSCGETPPPPTEARLPDANTFLNQPLIKQPYTAAPAARVFDGQLYIYPVHDIDEPGNSGAAGATFNSVDYHVFSLSDAAGPVTDHGPALHIGEVPWARRQLWAPDAAEKNGTYYLYFPAKDDKDIFRIGVATAQQPTGPFVPEAQAIADSYSIDPNVFKDDDGSHYLYLGGTQEGQLQRWQGGTCSEADVYPDSNQPTLLPRMAKLSDDMISLDHPLTTVPLLDENGNLINFGDTERRFYGAPWVHKYQGTYYLSWSTGATGFIQYATSDSPYGPFQWQGTVLQPVFGSSSHHAIVAFNEQWYLFYHDASQSGQDHLRTVKVTKLTHTKDGQITTIVPYTGN